MDIRVGDKTVTVNIPDGICIAGQDSGIGKTYLFKLVNASHELGNNVLGITYGGSTHSNGTVLSIIKSKHWDFIVVDRYDMYKSDELLKELQMVGCPVFVDYKGRIPMDMCACWCTITLHDGGISIDVNDF